MRKGILGSLAALAAGAGMAWGQTGPLPTSPSGKSFVGGPQVAPVGGYTPAPIIPPSVPVAGGIDGMMPQAGPIYPTPANFAGIDPESLPQVPSTDFVAPEAPHMWFGAEYLLWFAKSQPSNYPLVTTSSIQSAGRLLNPTTSTLFGGGDIPYNILNGFRVRGGWFYDADRRAGIELEGFVLQDKTKTFAASSDFAGSPVLARPFVNSNTGLQSSIVIATPNGNGTGPIGQAGSIIVSTNTESYSPEGNLVVNLFRSCPDNGWGVNVNFLTGIRYLELRETVSIQSTSSFLPNTPLPAAFGLFPAVLGNVGAQPTLVVIDSFRTMNQFYGGQIGLQTDITHGRWSLLSNLKFAVGEMHSRIDVQGVTTAVRGDGTPVTGSVLGGVLANAQNIGRYHRDRVAVLPEFGLTGAYAITSHLSFTAGYNFLYMTNVVRPGAIIDPRVNPGLVPSSPLYGQAPGVLPKFNASRASDYYVQGATVGFLLKY